MDLTSDDEDDMPHGNILSQVSYLSTFQTAADLFRALQTKPQSPHNQTLRHVLTLLLMAESGAKLSMLALGTLPIPVSLLNRAHIQQLILMNL